MRAISTPIHQSMTTEAIIARLQHIKHAQETIAMLHRQVQYAGNVPSHAGRMAAFVDRIDDFDGQLAERLRAWMEEISLIQTLFEDEYREELAFIRHYRG